MVFWSGQRLSSEGAKKQIVEPFDASRIDCSSYELTLGAEAFVTPHYGANPRDCVKLDLSEPKTITVGEKEQKCGGGKVVIPPGQFAFLLTEETIAVPAECMGFISLKSKPKFGGLINVSGFHVDPGFCGKLIFSVFNAGPNSLHFARGDRLFLLWIADLSFTGSDIERAEGRDLYRKTGVGYAEIPSDLVTKVAAENHSLQSLSRRVETLTSRVTIIGAVAAGLGVVFALLASWMAFAPDKIVGYEVQIERHSEPIPTPTVSPTTQPDNPAPPVTDAPNPPNPTHS